MHDQRWGGDPLTYWNGGGAHGYKAPVTLAPHTSYSFDRGAWHFIAIDDSCYLDTTNCSPAALLDWVKADLAAHPSLCTIAYWHQAYFTSTSGHGPFTTIQPVVQALYDAGVDVVLQGWNHNYERFAPQTPQRVADPARGIRAFVVGTGGIGFYPFKDTAANSVARSDSSFGVLHMTLRNGSYDWQFQTTSRHAVHRRGHRHLPLATRAGVGRASCEIDIDLLPRMSVFPLTHPNPLGAFSSQPEPVLYTMAARTRTGGTRGHGIASAAARAAVATAGTEVSTRRGLPVHGRDWQAEVRNAPRKIEVEPFRHRVVRCREQDLAERLDAEYILDRVHRIMPHRDRARHVAPRRLRQPRERDPESLLTTLVVRLPLAGGQLGVSRRVWKDEMEAVSTGGGTMPHRIEQCGVRLLIRDGDDQHPARWSPVGDGRLHGSSC